MASSINPQTITRRRTFAALAASGIGAALVPAIRASGANQATKVDYSDHPFCGSWMTMTMPSYEGGPPVPGVSINFSDGLAYYSLPVTQRGNNGVQFVSGIAGVWEPYDEHTGHFSSVQIFSDTNGDIVNIITIDGYPRVSDDGQSFLDDSKLSTITIYDANGNVLVEVPPGSPSPPVTGVRMSPGFFGFPTSATPEASPTT